MMKVVPAAEPLHEEEVDDSISASEDADGPEEDGSVSDAAPDAAAGEEAPEQGNGSDGSGSGSDSSSHSQGGGSESDSEDDQPNHSGENAAAVNGMNGAADAQGTQGLPLSLHAFLSELLFVKRTGLYLRAHQTPA